jgi:hypothetical protein
VAHEPNIADEIRERRAGMDIAGVIALNTGMAGAAFAPHDRRSSEPATGSRLHVNVGAAVTCGATRSRRTS